MHVDESFADLQIAPEDLEATGPGVSLAGATIPDGIPEQWETILRHNPRVRRPWQEPGSYPSASEAANAIAWYAGAYGLTKEQAAAVLVAFYAVPGRKPLHRSKLELTLRTWAKGRARLDAWDRGAGNGEPPESEPGEPGPEVGQPAAGDGRPAEQAGPEGKPEGGRGDDPPPPLVVPAREFLERPRTVLPKLVPRLGGRRGGKLGLYGPGGSGKSYTVLNMAVAASEGRPLLGHPEWAVPFSLRVALVSLEDPASEQLDRLQRLLPFFGLPAAPETLHIFDRELEEEGFILAGRGGAVNERAFRRLDACLGDLKIDLLLLEPKSHLVEVEENSSSENVRWQRRFQDLLIRHGTLAIVGHHAGWDRDGKIHARGTTVFRDWVDGMIQQVEDQIQDKPGFLLTCNKSNFAARWAPLCVLFDPATGGLTAVDEATGKLPPALLRACFEEHGGAIGGTVEQIRVTVAKYGSCSEATARRAVEAAIKGRWLRSLGRGKGIGLTPQEGPEP